MSFKFTVDKSGLRKLERKMAKNIEKAASRRLPSGMEIDKADADQIAKQATREIESMFKRVGK